MAARGRVRLRTARHGDARHSASGAGRCRKAAGLDDGNLVGDACAAAQHRRQHADARGVADPAAGPAPDRSAGGRRAAAARATACRCTTSRQKRIVHHLVLKPPMRTSALRGLGALPNVFALECFMDELAERAGVDPVRLPAVPAVRSPRAAADRERGGALRLGLARAGGQRARRRPGLGALQEQGRLCRGRGGGRGRPGSAGAARMVRRGCRSGDQPGWRAQPVGRRHRAGHQHDAEGADEAGRGWAAPQWTGSIIRS